jgi:hypothetical protein
MLKMFALGASLLAAFAVALAGAAAPADAHYLSSTAWSKARYGDTHLNLLRWPPRNVAFKPCITRRVKLTYGYWDHNAYVVSESHRTDPDINTDETPVLIPSAGTYKWVACRWWTTTFRDYRVLSTLSRGNRTVDESLQELSGNHIYDKREGMYEWGGRIAFDHPAGVTEPQD